MASRLPLHTMSKDGEAKYTCRLSQNGYGRAGMGGWKEEYNNVNPTHVVGWELVRALPTIMLRTHVITFNVRFVDPD